MLGKHDENGFWVSFMGYTVKASPHMTRTIEDWSRVRSPSRARRRRAKHRQNIVARHEPIPDVLVIESQKLMIAHPDIVDELKRKIDEMNAGAGMDRALGRIIDKAAFGWPPGDSLMRDMVVTIPKRQTMTTFWPVRPIFSGGIVKLDTSS